MVKRTITKCLLALFKQYPVVTITGPRQSGKTTLCRAAFPGLHYVNLESPDNREFALEDPRGFLSQYGQGAVLDEIQRAPELVSYLQDHIDNRRRNGLFVILLPVIRSLKTLGKVVFLWITDDQAFFLNERAEGLICAEYLIQLDF